VTQNEEERERRRRQMYRDVVNKAEDNMLECTTNKFELAKKHGVSDDLTDFVEGDTGD
jgi:hypothetical protein